MIPTTDQMDSTTPEERYKLVAMCNGCGEWKHFTGSPDKMSQTVGLECDHCGDKKFSNLISERTFDIERAKKETAKLKRKAKK